MLVICQKYQDLKLYPTIKVVSMWTGINKEFLISRSHSKMMDEHLKYLSILNMKKWICTKCWIDCDEKYTLCTEHWEAWEESRKERPDYRCLVNIYSPKSVRKGYTIGDYFHNCVRCLHCGFIVESLNLHDYQTCPCWTVSVDGGSQYLKRWSRWSSSVKDYREMSVKFKRKPKWKK